MLELKQNIEEYIEEYVTFDEPIPYKTLKIYPILMKDIFKFISSYDILKIQKNKTGDVKIIKMNYLEFVFNLLLSDKEWGFKFLNIMKLCLKIDFDKKNFLDDFEKGIILQHNVSDTEKVFFYNGYNIKFFTYENKIKLFLNDVEITPKEFDEIKKIIMYQNINNHDDDEMSDDFRKVVNDYYKIKNKGMKPLKLEDKITTVMSQTSYTKNEIKEMTYRHFDQIFDKNISKIEYIVNKMAEIQGCIKEDVEHWVYKKDTNKYSHIFSDADKYTDEIMGKH